MSDTFLLLLAYFVVSSVFGGILALVLAGPSQAVKPSGQSVAPEMNFRYRTLERKYQLLEDQKHLTEKELHGKLDDLRHRLDEQLEISRSAEQAVLENASLKEKLSILEQVKESLSGKIQAQTETYKLALQEAENLRRKSQLEVISLKAEIGQLKVQLSSFGHFERSTSISAKS
ncbi:MAG: hypothetical protein KC649_06500 [Candidatus Omnitrophica bacterium]|nr:hypothetical protein [Candidatus Omnitrophota bacterium]